MFYLKRDPVPVERTPDRACFGGENGKGDGKFPRTYSDVWGIRFDASFFSFSGKNFHLTVTTDNMCSS